MKNWWLLLVGLFAGLWLSERERRLDVGRKAVGVQAKVEAKPESVAPRKSRTLEELAPIYKELVAKYTGDDQLYEDHENIWIKFVREAVQAGLTELEAAEVAQAVLSFQPPAYNYFPPLFPSWEKEDKDKDE